MTLHCFNATCAARLVIGEPGQRVDGALVPLAMKAADWRFAAPGQPLCSRCYAEGSGA